MEADRAVRARHAALAGALLAVAALGTAVLLTGPADPGSQPTATPAGPRAAATPDPPDTPAPGPPAVLTPVPGLEELVAQVSALRGLEPRQEVRSSLVSQAELAAIVSEVAFEEIDPVEIEADGRLLAALRLVPPGIDLLGVVEDLYREQIVGLYVPGDETLYVRARAAELSPFERYTAAHEVTHALQDQAFGLEELRDLPDEESDKALAVLALVEGDAVLTQQLWSFAHQSEEERDELRGEAQIVGGDALGRAPRYVREALAFPYREGTAFVQALFERGGFAAVDAAYADPPATTAQIYHPQRYAQGTGPVPVALRDDAGPGWDEPRTYTFGEFDLRELMAPLGAQTATAVGTGWAGGRVRGWQRGEDTALAVAFAFDSPADALETCDAVPRWYTEVADGSREQPQVMRGDLDWMAWSCTDLEVRFGLAPDAETATRLTNPG